MRPSKPIYPPPWWNEYTPCAPDRECLSVGDDIIFTFVGYDANGNPLFCLKRPRPSCDPKRDCCTHKRRCYQ